MVRTDGDEFKSRRLSAKTRRRCRPEPDWPTTASTPAWATAALPRQSKRAAPRCGVLATHPLQHPSIARLSQGDREYSILRGRGMRASASEYSCHRWASLDALGSARDASRRRCLRRCGASGGSGGGVGRGGHSVPAPMGGTPLAVPCTALERRALHPTGGAPSRALRARFGFHTTPVAAYGKSVDEWTPPACLALS